MTVQHTSITEALDDFSFHNVIGRKLSNSIPDLNGMTTATIERYIPWLGMSHSIASNTSLKDRSPYYREYSKVFYREDERPSIQEIDLGYYDPDLEGRYFYRVTHLYYEDIYSSTFPFYQWEFERLAHMYEVLRYKGESSLLKWERPLLPYQHESLPSQYETVGSSLSLNINMNSAVGVHITSDCEYIVKSGDLTFHSSNGTISIPIVKDSSLNILCTKVTNQINQVMRERINGMTTYIYKESISDGDTYEDPTPTYFNISMRGGNIAQRAYHPMGEIEEEETLLLHKANTPLEKRLIPPGIRMGNPDFPITFWNYNGCEPQVSKRIISTLSAPPSLV